MTFDELQRAVSLAFTSYRRDTNLEPKVDYLELRIHPNDHADLVATANKWYFNLEALLGDHGVLGVPLIQDPEVKVGHPELRSTWKWVL